jgi:hypothetical protein
MLGAEGNNMWI